MSECMDSRLRLQELIGAAQNATSQHEAPPVLQWARSRGKIVKEGGMVCVAPGLFLGNKMAAADSDLLLRFEIVGVCAVGAKQVFAGPGHHVSIEDDGSESMLPHFDAACRFIHNHRSMGGVLVHCKGGISRSPTMIVAYLMKYEQLSLRDAMEVCSLARPAARPRANFLSDLQVYETMMEEEHQWLRAVDLVNEMALERMGPREPGPSKKEIQAECRRLLEALQDWCVMEVFGEPREPSIDLREAAMAAVTNYANQHSWKSRIAKEAT